MSRLMGFAVLAAIWGHPRVAIAFVAIDLIMLTLVVAVKAASEAAKRQEGQ